MFQRDPDTRAYTCPDCGSKLIREHDLLHCESHGAFFTYGPQLLVRAPRENGKHYEPLMPWESQSSARAR